MRKFLFRFTALGLNFRIMVLLLGALVLSLALTDLLIYRLLKSHTYAQAGQLLLQTAAVTAAALPEKELNDLKESRDVRRPEYAAVKQELKRIARLNRFDREDNPGRLTLWRFNQESGRLVQLVSLEGGKNLGKTATPSQELRQAVREKRAVAVAAEPGALWLKAWAPLSADEKTPASLSHLLCVELSTAPLAAVLTRYRLNILLASAAGLLLALVSGIFFTRRITGPLKEFIHGMQLMRSTGNFDLRIDLHPGDKDLSAVEESFAALIAKMKESRKKEEDTYWATLQALVSALDARDNDTTGHSIRVTRYALAIADRMHLSEAEREQLKQGALLHDLGKIGISDAILKKPGRLTVLEWKDMKQHPDIGNRLLSGIEFLEHARQVVYAHHERWDGTGYPQGLKGEEIPLAARIFSVADSFDAITSDRYYKKARPIKEAQKEISRCSGYQFDPQVVAAFEAITEKAFVRICRETEDAFDESRRLRRKVA